jgi:hypothetical protein
MNHDHRSLDECQQPFQRALAEPGPRPDEFRALADAIVTNASNRGQSAYVTTDANVPVDANQATAGEALAQRGPSPSSLQANDMSSFPSTTGYATAAVFDTTSLLSIAAGTASPATPSMTVTTDKVDYAPGSTATFSVAGVNPGSSVAFQIADLAADPGINGIADVYAPFRVADGGTGDADGLANGTVIARWQIPTDGSATGASLQLTATSDGQTAIRTFSDAPNKIVTENLNAGTPTSVWAIHGSIANQGDSQIEGFATQISTNAGQTSPSRSIPLRAGTPSISTGLATTAEMARASSRPCTTVEALISRPRSSIARPTPSTPETGRLRIHGQFRALPCRGSTSPS